jgi:hypothetical protein
MSRNTQLTGELREINLDRRRALVLSSEGRRAEIYFGPEQIEKMRAALGRICVFSGQWVESLFFDVWAVR